MHGEFEMQDPKSEDEVVRIFITDKEGVRREIRGKIGDNLLYLAHRYQIPMEGACEASLACTTCHVYVNQEMFDKLPEATEKEEDLLDMAPFLKENSRLGCQIILRKDLEGMDIILPKATRNFYFGRRIDFTEELCATPVAEEPRKECLKSEALLGLVFDSMAVDPSDLRQSTSLSFRRGWKSGCSEFPSVVFVSPYKGVDLPHSTSASEARPLVRGKSHRKIF
ncbi:unnamed protein product [Cyprideis torosa]|uniref:Uncharacterized protein n=1 Tax=Cyprideis torosa TaxID=163714 RepID=A0A7R8ZPV7_9CRUS|nr:unnamed protein product [Cyprideis torosa]CAG0894894.1 unnamed protein product [Cyprideis torosa]